MNYIILFILWSHTLHLHDRGIMFLHMVEWTEIHLFCDTHRRMSKVALFLPLHCSRYVQHAAVRCQTTDSYFIILYGKRLNFVANDSSRYNISLFLCPVTLHLMYNMFSEIGITFSEIKFTYSEIQVIISEIKWTFSEIEWTFSEIGVEKVKK